jgi:hypothetical protein
MAIPRTRPLAGPVPHPGEVLKDELEARGLSAHVLAIALRLRRRGSGQRAVTLLSVIYIRGSAHMQIMEKASFERCVNFHSNSAWICRHAKC